MSREHRRPMTEAERKAIEALQNLPPAKADPDFRESLKQQFLRGAAPPSAAGRSRHRVTPAPSKKRWPLVLLAGAAVAATLLIVLGIFGRGPVWRIEGGNGDGVLRIGERTFRLAELKQAAEWLSPGTRIATDGTAEVTLRAGDQMVLVLTPGSEAILPETFGWWEGESEAEVIGGEVRLTTLPGFEGSSLHFITEESMVQVTGTTLAVIRNEQGTCLCVFEGRVHMKDRMGAEKDEMTMVPKRMRRVVYRDERAPIMEPLEPMEEMKLQMLRESFPPTKR